MNPRSLDTLNRKITACKLCPRLVRWRTKVAREKTLRYRDQEYWGKPIPGFGDPHARLLLVGLAPAAHGGNRTGRMFTGDRSGDWLYRALYNAGFARHPRSIDRNDGQELTDCFITATCRCAPPLNKPLHREIRNCRPFLHAELRILDRVEVIVGLGKLGFDTAYQAFVELGRASLPRKPRFGHGVEVQLNESVTLLGSFHPSQQNTFTGRLTEPMFNAVFRRVNTLLNRRNT